MRADDGETLEVACSSKVIGGVVMDKCGAAIEDNIGWRIVPVVTLWAGAAAENRVEAGGWCGELAKQGVDQISAAATK